MRLAAARMRVHISGIDSRRFSWTTRRCSFFARPRTEYCNSWSNLDHFFCLYVAPFAGHLVVFQRRENTVIAEYPIDRRSEANGYSEAFDARYVPGGYGHSSADQFRGSVSAVGMAETLFPGLRIRHDSRDKTADFLDFVLASSSDHVTGDGLCGEHA